MRLPFVLVLVLAATVFFGGRAADAVLAYSRPAVQAADRPLDAGVLHTVRIDAIASDSRGESVTDLTAGDFDLREDGAPRAVERVEFTRPSRRLFAIFLDEYHVSAGASAARARLALARFVAEELGPDDRVAAMKPLDSLFEIRATTSREALAQAIATFEGRKGDYTVQNAYEGNFIAGDPARIEAARLQVVVSAINALANELGRMDDTRKTVIVVTEALGRPARSRGREYLATIDTAIRSANRANVSIYAVDPRYPPGSPGAGDSSGPGTPGDPGNPGNNDAVRTITSQTAGEASAGADVAGALHRIGRDSRGYYVLTYRAAHREDGAFHPVQLRVRRPGVQMRARAGYWAPSPDDALRAAVLAEAREPRPVPRVELQHTSALIRPWFGLSRAQGGRTRVAFAWEAAVRVPGDRSPRFPSRVVLTALGADEAVIFEGPVPPTGATPFEGQLGSSARAVFDAPPGTLRLRMKIEDETAQVIDTDVRDLRVGDWSAPVALGTPEVLRARNAREFRLLDAHPESPPVVSREFSRTERLLIRFPAYAPADAPPTVTARLLGRSGTALRELKVERSPAPDTRQVDLPLASLAPGEYAIELGAASSAGEVKDRLQFRVTN